MEFLQFAPERDFKLLLIALLIPLAGYTIQIFAGRFLPRKGDWMLVGGMFASMCITVLMFAKSLYAAFRDAPLFAESVDHGLSFRWLYSGADAGNNVVAGLLYDPLGAAMLMVVGVVCFCVHLFSVGYMREDRRYHIFFANISLFTFAMLGLVLSDNILFMFVFWEIMGLMSYLLIGHFAHDPTSPRIRQAAAACKKAFLTTRVGDVCLFVGIVMFYREFHTFRFSELWEAAQAAVAANGGDYPAWMTVAGLFTIGGTIGKSAQFPLHIWLPDAMEGPTPVSAMIHAATMVAAGVFLLGRTYPLLSPEVLAVVTAVGAFTALFAATIGTTVNDIKGVLAYSTISQLGFMVAAIGLGGVVAGLFHMVTHAFFKGCLFLCAGSVIHGCHHEQDMRYMGGLRRFMPVTFVCMLVSTLAIAGIPFFSGFYSKDMIVLSAFQSTLSNFTGPHFFASIALPLAALLTAFYMFRLIFMTFFGEYRGAAHAHAVAHASPHGAHGHEASHGPAHGTAGHDHHAHDPHEHHAAAHSHGMDHGHEDAHGHAHVPHESPLTMTAALCILAALGMLGGHFWLGDALHSLAFWHAPETWFERLSSLQTLYPGVFALPDAHGAHGGGHGDHIAHLAHTLAVTVSLAVALGGVALAYVIYGRGWERSQRITDGVTGALGEIYHWVKNKYFVDEMVEATVVRGSERFAQLNRSFDENVVDGIVNGAGRVGKSGGFLSAWFDLTFVDGLVNGVGAIAQTFGSAVRLMQTGRVQQYVAFAVGGSLMAAAWLILS